MCIWRVQGPLVLLFKHERYGIITVYYPCLLLTVLTERGGHAIFLTSHFIPVNTFYSPFCS